MEKKKKEKVIKLTEENLINIIKRVINEQSDESLGPFPDKKPVEVTPKGEGQNVKYGTPEAILKGKGVVRQNLQNAMGAMQQLTAMTGINTDTNDVVPDIKKALENFENLFGDPKPEMSEDSDE